MPKKCPLETMTYTVLLATFSQRLKRIVDSMSTNPEVSVDIVEQLLKLKERLKAKYKNANKMACLKKG